MKLKSLFFSTALLVGVNTIVLAAPVNISVSNSDTWNKSVVGTYIKNTKISFSNAGSYTLNLQDADSSSNFEMLGASIFSPSVKYVDLVLGVDNKSISRDFKIDKAGDYFLNVFAITDSIANPTAFSLSVNAVPLPSAVIFLSSALMGLVAFMRRRPARSKV
jgi:hypothetical protein